MRPFLLNRLRWAWTVKVAVAVTALAVGVWAAFALVSHASEQRSLRAVVEGEADLLLDTIAGSSVNALISLDVNGLGRQVNALSANPTVLGVRFYDAEGRIIADGDQQQPLFQLQPDAAGQRYAASDLTIFAWGGDRLVASRAVTVGNQRLGAISLGLSTATIDAAIAAARNRDIGIGLGILVAGVLLALWLNRHAEAERRKHEAQLQHARRMDTIGNLAGGIAHDFNNLLTVASTNLDEAAVEAPAATRAAIRRANSATKSAGGLAQELLAIGRSSGGRRAPLALGPLAAEVVELLERTLGGNIAVRHEVAADLTVIGNAASLKRVLLNLAVNAREAMPDGGALTIRARALQGRPERVALPAREAGYVLVEVEDTGSGMDAETAARMYDPFFSGRTEGSGLGAAVVYGIVREHEGMVAAESTPGTGTTMRVYLPAAASIAEAAEGGGRQVVRNGERSILIVDDLGALCRATQAIFERAGHQTRVANCGNEALEIVGREGKEIDLLLLDCTLSDVSGRQVYETLRSEYRSQPVLFTSGYGWAVLEDLRPSPDWAFLPKPYDGVALLDAVHALLESNPAPYAPPQRRLV